MYAAVAVFLCSVVCWPAVLGQTGAAGQQSATARAAGGLVRPAVCVFCPASHYNLFPPWKARCRQSYSASEDNRRHIIFTQNAIRAIPRRCVSRCFIPWAKLPCISAALTYREMQSLIRAKLNNGLVALTPEEQEGFFWAYNLENNITFASPEEERRAFADFVARISRYVDQEGDLRLVGSLSSRAGRLEIYHNSTWGSICRTGFDTLDATVACRQLRLGERAAIYRGPVFGVGAGPIWLSLLRCNGSEARLAGCPRSGSWGVAPRCTHASDVTVRCDKAPSAATQPPVFAG